MVRTTRCAYQLFLCSEYCFLILLGSILDILLDVYQYLLDTNYTLSPLLDAIVDSEDLKRQALYPG